MPLRQAGGCSAATCTKIFRTASFILMSTKHDLMMVSLCVGPAVTTAYDTRSELLEERSVG